MIKFREESIDGIKFVYTPSEAIASIRSALVSMFTLAKAIPGTRGYQFETSTDSAIKMKRISYDDDIEKKTCLSNAEAKNIKVSKHLLYKYDRLYWIGMASEIDPSAYNIKVKLMHPNYPS